MINSIKQTYRRLRFGEPIIIVSGLPRSGTSMMMKMLDAAGYEMVVDGIRTADIDNPKGYYELERVKNLAQETDKSWLEDARGKVVKIVSQLLKELPADNNYKVIFMRRSLTEVLASQAKMLTNRDEVNESEDEKIAEMFTDHLWRADYLIKHAPHIQSLDIRYKEALENPLQAAESVAQFLGSPLDTRKMAGVVDESLYRNRA